MITVPGGARWEPVGPDARAARVTGKGRAHPSERQRGAGFPHVRSWPGCWSDSTGPRLLAYWLQTLHRHV